MLHSNVYILGFGLGYEEIDLWYFLTVRKQSHSWKIIRKKQNNPYYSINDNSLDIGKAKLLEALDVEVESITVGVNTHIKKAYDMIYDKILIQQEQS